MNSKRDTGPQYDTVEECFKEKWPGLQRFLVIQDSFWPRVADNSIPSVELAVHADNFLKKHLTDDPIYLACLAMWISREKGYISSPD